VLTICIAGTLLIAFATASKQLRTVRALIDWGQPKTNEKIHAAALPLNPTIRTRHLAVTSWMNESSGDSQNASNVESSMAHLSHLEFLSPCPDATGRLTSSTILAIRSHLPLSMSHYNQDVQSTIDRWEIGEKPQSVHPAFEALSSRRNSVGSQPGVSSCRFIIPLSNSSQAVGFLKKLESFTVNKIIVATQTINLGKILFIAYSDGSVEYRDRVTMAETLNDNDLNRVWHLSQIGFSYPEDDPCMKLKTRDHFLEC